MSRRLSRLAQTFALLLVPFSIVGVNASIPGFESFFVFRLLLVLLSIITPAVILLDTDLAVDFLRSVNAKRYLLLPLVLLVYSAITIFTSVDKGEAVRFTVLLGTGTLNFYFLLFYLSGKEALAKFYNMVVITFTLTIVVAAVEMVVPGFRMPNSNLIGAPARFQLALTSFFHNQNDFSTYVVLTFPFLYWPLIAAGKWSKGTRKLLFGLAVLGLFVYSFSSSKINILALLALAVATVFYLFSKDKFALEKQKTYGYLVTGLILLLFAFPTAGPTLKDAASQKLGGLSYGYQLAYEQRQSTLPINEADISTGKGLGSLRVRLRLVENCFEIISARGISGYAGGVGAGNIEYFMANYTDLGGLTNLHNWWLEIFADFGLFGALSVGLFIFYLIKDNWKLAKRSDDIFAVISLSSLLVLLFVALSPSSLKGQQMQWLVFAFAAANASAKLKPGKA